MMKLCYHLFFLCTLFVLTWSFALVDKGAAVTVTHAQAGSPATMGLYNTLDLLDPSQDWLFNHTTGQIFLKYYPNLVLGSSFGFNVVVFDKNTLTASAQSQTNWSLTWNGLSAQFKNVRFNTYLAHLAGAVFAQGAKGGFVLFNPFPTSDYIVAGTGTAGAKIAKRLTDDLVTSVISIDAGARVDDNPLVQAANTIRDVESSSFFNFAYYSEKIDNLGGSKAPAGVGKMWGGTSNHNGFLYDKGLRYDWEQMEAAGGPNWNYDKYIKQQFFNQENYTGNSTSGFGTAGEISIIDSVFVPSAVNAVPISAAQQLYPSFTQSEGLDSNVSTGSVSTFQLTMKNYGGGNYIRESSSTAHLNKNIITVEGKGVGGRKLTVIGEAFVDQLVFHPFFPKRAIGVKYVDKNGQTRIVLANKEVIISAGVYNSPAILMRSGVGNCTELSTHNISCRENNVYVGSNLQDHMRVQVAFSIPISTVLLVSAGGSAKNSNGHILEGRIFTNLSDAYTDLTITNETQPDTKLTMLVFPQLPFPEIATLYKLNWLSPFSLPGIFEWGAVLLRPKCTGQVTLASSQPVAAPLIKANYLCHPDDLAWARIMFRNLSKIVDIMSANDSSYQVVFPPKSMLNDDVQLQRVVRALTNSYRHPAGSVRMAPRNDISKGVVDGDLRVYGISNVRVVDASVFVAIPSSNLQAAVYALAGRAVDLIKAAHSKD